MESKDSEPRFQQFIEQFNSKGDLIGFKLPDNDFLFEYDSDGGWYDQKGVYYNKDGVQQSDQPNSRKSSRSRSRSSESDIDDDQIIDQFQQMLLDQEYGIARPKKQKKQKQPAKESQKSQPVEVSEQEQVLKYIEKFKNKQQIRQGLPAQIFIYFKMKTSAYQEIKPQAEQIKDGAKKIQYIKTVKAAMIAKREEILKNNTWLQGDFLLDFSGTSPDIGIYDRYWYGWVKVSHEKFIQTVAQIKNSKQFSTLRTKTFYALISKFYLKSKMKATIAQLKKSIQKVTQNGAVQISFNNLPQQFPLSLIFDLIELSGGKLEDVEEAQILDDFSASIIVKKATADLVTNIEGYCYEQKQYIWLDVKDLERQIKYNALFNVIVDSTFKIPHIQLIDTLAFNSSFTQLAKIYTKDDKFRVAVNQKVLKRLLMYRGQTLNFQRVVRFVKVEEK